MHEQSPSILLVGAGNMGGALLAGWLEGGTDVDRVCVLDPAISDAMAKHLSQKCVRHERDAENCKVHGIIVVAVKPQVMEKVLPQITHCVGAGSMVISVAAGKTLAFMEEHFPGSACIRVMPNTPSLVGKGASVLCANGQTSQAQKDMAASLMMSVGSVHIIEDEGLMDAVTALSGSGPAYVFLLAEVMAQAGEAAGLPSELAQKLARETVSGGGHMLEQSDVPACTLRENVTSPGGTTEAALGVLRGENGFPELMKKAIAAAARRSRELS